MVMASSARWPASSLILAFSAARSELPGWYCLIGSLNGGGTRVTASMLATFPRHVYPLMQLAVTQRVLVTSRLRQTGP